MAKRMWRVMLVAEQEPGLTTEVEVARLERDEPSGLAGLGLRLAEAKQLAEALQAAMIATRPRAGLGRMTELLAEPVAVFSAGERAYIRGELDLVFSTLPTVAEGFQLKTWRGGPDAGKPKLSPIAKGLVERGLMRLDTSQRLPKLFFTETGLAGLRAMMADRRLADPKKFAHVRHELGIDPAE